jgi:hypothetical protein
MQELSDSIKRPNLRNMGIEEEVEAKGIGNIFKSRARDAHPGTGSL